MFFRDEEALMQRFALGMTRLLLIVPIGIVLVVPAAEAADADYSLYDEVSSRQKIVGPLIGEVTDTSARIWAYAGPRNSEVILEIAAVSTTAPDRDLSDQNQRIVKRPDSDQHHAVHFHVEGLFPETNYVFAVRLAEDPEVVEPGRFTTGPEMGKPGKFSAAVSSCFGGRYRRREGHTTETHGYRSDSWFLLMQERPDFQLIVGDNVYADSTDYNHHWDSHTLERVDNRPFAQAIRTIPTFAVWDDHDFGPNNSDGTEPGKENSLRAFHEVFVNPPREDDGHPGIYTMFQWADVDFFLLDNRYHRSPNEELNDENKRMLGDEQFEWLVAQLKKSKAPFKVLVNGSTWQASRADGWRIYEFEQDRIWKAIVENDISGVVFVSGDIHHSDLVVHQAQLSGGYPFIEVISSGLGSHGEYAMLSFAMMDFDTTLDDPVLEARVIDGSGFEVVKRRVRASDLQVRK
jgi:alkaline phosphatase D